MRKGLIGLALIGLLFLGLMLFAPSGADKGEPPNWTRSLGDLLGGFAPRVRSLGGQTEIVLESDATRRVAIPAAPDQKVRLLTLRHLSGGAVVATFTCKPTAKDRCDPSEATGCLGQPLDPACEEQVKAKDRGQEVSFTIGPGGGTLDLRSTSAASRLGVAQ